MAGLLCCVLVSDNADFVEKIASETFGHKVLGRKFNDQCQLEDNNNL